MPINIYKMNEARDKIAWLGDDVWDLPSQIPLLEDWLKKHETLIPPGEYVADVGFQVRKDASAGGSVVTKEMMRIMSFLGIELYLSEYQED